MLPPPPKGRCTSWYFPLDHTHREDAASNCSRYALVGRAERDSTPGATCQCVCVCVRARLDLQRQYGEEGAEGLRGREREGRVGQEGGWAGGSCAR